MDAAADCWKTPRETPGDEAFRERLLSTSNVERAFDGHNRLSSKRFAAILTSAHLAPVSIYIQVEVH